MNNELLTMLEYIAHERDINKDELISAVESAIASSCKKKYSGDELVVKLDPKTGELRAWRKLTVVENFPVEKQISITEARTRFPNAMPGDMIDWEISPRELGRIAAQCAKQTIKNELSNVEKKQVQAEYEDKVGEIINGTVKRLEQSSIIVDMQKSEGILGPKDKVPGELYMVGERINALLLKVDTKSKGPSLILTRSNAAFVKKLFEREVSEIHDGVVEIAGIAREAGMRTKIAVRSNDHRVDPVGACVGMRGMRVRNITAELGNERVDIIKYDEDIRVYATNALHPAKLEAIEVDEERRMLTIHITQENSRLAFGKKAQNVRLAQKLIGWNINFVMDEEQDDESFEEKKALIIEQLATELSITPEKAQLLVNNGYLSMDGLKTAGMKDIETIAGLDEEDLASIEDALSRFAAAPVQQDAE